MGYEQCAAIQNYINQGPVLCASKVGIEVQSTEICGQLSGPSVYSQIGVKLN